MKILLLNLWRVIESKGGTEKVFFDMANNFSEKGHEVIAVAMDNRKGHPFFPLGKKVEFVNVRIDLKNYDGIKYKIRRAIYINREKRHKFDEDTIDNYKAGALKLVLECEKPDIIISFNVEATRLLMNYLNVACPVITMFHFDPDTILKDITVNTKNALEKCACIQVLLPSHVAIVKKYIECKNIVCIPNTVPQYESSVVEPLREDTVITIGRVEQKQKRQHLLIEVFNKIKDIFPEWKLEIWGEIDYNKEYYKYCLKLIKKYKLENRVFFCGTTNNVHSKLIKAKIFAFPSAYEGFGLALGEAMSAGLPAIGYKNCAAVNELIIGGHNGYLCEDGIDDFANKFKQLISDDKLRKQWGENAKDSMKEFAPGKIWNEWEDLIKKIVANHN